MGTIYRPYKRTLLKGELPAPTVSALGKSAIITMTNMKMKVDAANQELTRKA
ncbi:MAG: hypothetical protein WA364_04130 [Candidatus Nitrosopolaris sp.]